MMVYSYNILPDQVRIHPDRVFRLLQMDAADAPEPYRSVVEEELQRISGYHDMMGGFRIIDEVFIDRKAGQLRAGGITFNVGRQVARFLAGSEAIAFYVCTAGATVSNHIGDCFRSGDPVTGYVADLVGSLLADEVMDVVNSRIPEVISASDARLTNRYSPGYCDWQVSEQQQLFSLLPREFCGITLTESSLMTPVKSVSGAIGIGRDVRYHKDICNACGNVHCHFRHFGVNKES